MFCRQIVDRCSQIVKSNLSSYYKSSYVLFVDSRQMKSLNFLRDVIMMDHSLLPLQLVLIYINLSTVTTRGRKL
jgi:hypothetical protein